MILFVCGVCVFGYDFMCMFVWCGCVFMYDFICGVCKCSWLCMILFVSLCGVCVCAERAESGGAEGCAVQTRSPQSHWRPAQAKNGECFACPSLVSLLSFVSTPPLQQESLPTSGGDFACAMVFLHMHILLLPPYMQCMLTSKTQLCCGLYGCLPWVGWWFLMGGWGGGMF